MNPLPDDPRHRILVERLGAHVLGGLDATERREVDDHLAGCASCRAERAAIAPLADPLRRLDPDRLDPDRTLEGSGAPAPAGLDEVLRRVRAEEAGTAEARPGPTPVVLPAPRRRRPRAAVLLAAGALVVALAGGAVGYGLGARAGQGPQDPVAVRALVPGVEADAATIPHTWGVEVVLTARGFDPGRTYRVAVTDRAGRAVGAGAFVGTGAGAMVCRLNSSVLPQEATGFVVTTGEGEEVLRSRFA